MSTSPSSPAASSVVVAGSSRAARRAQLADELGVAFKALKARFSAETPEDVRAELAAVTQHQCEALVDVVRNGGMTMNDLARSVGVGLSSCTPLIDRLQRHGLVERASDPADRRVVRVVPTPRGQELVERFVAARRQTFHNLLAVLDDDDAATFVRLFSAMARGAKP